MQPAATCRVREFLSQQKLPNKSNPPPSTVMAPSRLDSRFRALLSAAEWASLPAAVRRRFSKRLEAGRSIAYRGVVVEMRMSLLGWLLAHAARPFGAPFPLDRQGVGQAVVVTVTEDGATGGQTWTRVYARRAGFPQVIHSIKRFDGPTGVEEEVRGGLGMALCVFVEGRSLLFRSAGYFITLLGRRVRVPDWATPGVLKVGHRDLGDDEFQFTLTLTHARWGELIHQAVRFRDGEGRP